MIRVAVIDDHEIIRLGLSVAIGAADDLDLAGTYSSIEEYGQRVVERPDIAILDLGLAGLEGPEAVAFLVREGLPVLVVSATGSRQMVLTAIAAGAVGYLTKRTGSSEIMQAVRTIHDDGCHVSPTLAAFVRAHLRAVEGPDAISDTEDEVLTLVAQGESPAGVASLLGIDSSAGVMVILQRTLAKTRNTFGGTTALSSREREVLLQVVRGRTSDEIAADLGLSPKTVGTYRRRIAAKTGAHKQTDLARFAYESGILRPGELNGDTSHG
ncbi:MAG: response regulator transcription factor [Acidimicrobiia bacterium]|nr:response regulator transcription factor [Acidimicrobiia bacterium]